MNLWTSEPVSLNGVIFTFYALIISDFRWKMEEIVSRASLQIGVVGGKTGEEVTSLAELLCDKDQVEDVDDAIPIERRQTNLLGPIDYHLRLRS